jgi:ribosomal-protein-alanine N-acetyltransferase
MSESKSIQLIRATAQDVDELLEVEKTTIGLKVYSGYFTKEELGDWVNDEIVFLIKNGDDIVGSLSYQIKSNDHAYISGLVIKKKFQRKGFAMEAMKKLIDEHLKNYKLIDLAVHPENHAVMLYEELGFQKGKMIENYFGDGEPRMMMEKRFGQDLKLKK